MACLQTESQELEGRFGVDSTAVAGGVEFLAGGESADIVHRHRVAFLGVIRAIAGLRISKYPHFVW